MRNFLRVTVRIVVIIFAIIGFVFTSVFVAMQFDLLNVPGNSKDRNQFFLDAAKEIRQSASVVSIATSTAIITPQMATTTPSAPTPQELPDTPCIDPQKTICTWNETPEWVVIKSALIKDDTVIARVAEETGVEKRMIASVIVPEQARFFTSNREVFKRWFEPMKIFGSLSQFSLGVSGIKQETATRIEEYANDPASPFYPGLDKSKLIAHAEGVNSADDIFKRLTDEKNHYYSYLYTALYVKEVQEQWKRAGYDITHNPEAIVTLFNLGFDKSLPNATPEAGGAIVTLGNTNYMYGTLGALFYHSEELLDTMPR
ncbi:MAG: hypothetical protein KBD24_01060 [Candidatus Pacebacteria bacterium]|nr:hypothetical protein [Candidatus Paceibacterota bacterium]